MARSRKASAAALDFGPDDASSLSGSRQEAWSETERTIVKSALSSGVRRCTDLGLLPAELSDGRARAVWTGALARIEAGARVVWLDGSLVAELGKTMRIEDARASVAWVKEAAEEADDDSVDALIARVRDRIYTARVYSLAARLRQEAEDGTTASAARSSMVITELRDLTDTRRLGASAVEMVAAVDAFDAWRKEAESERADSGKLPVLGLATVDQWTRKPLGKLTVIAAESHVGKTGIIAGAVLATARKGIHASVVSSDDPWPEIVSRMAAELGNFNPQEVRNPQRTFDLDERLAKARGSLGSLPIHGVEIKDRSVDGVLAAIRYAAARGSRLVAIDHWNSIRRPRWVAETADRRDASDEIIGALLACAAERDVHIIVAAQLNRDKTRKEVTLNDLRETQSLGEAAHNVIGLWREDAKVVCGILKAKGTTGRGKRVTLVRNNDGTLVEPDEAEVF